MIPLIVLRPEPGNAATLAAGRAEGLDAHGFPLFTIEPRAWTCPAAGDFDAVLAGSANAFRHGGGQLAALRRLPVHAVGESTAEAARAAGFALAGMGSGGLQGLLDGMAGPLRLLRLAGEERIAITPPPGVTIAERVVYASTAQPLAALALPLLRAGAVVLLHSAEAARHFAAQCDAAGLDRARIDLALIGPRLIAAAGTGWGHVATAAVPSDAALLALARRMCQRPA
ncbi:MAG: uroporphyrinogen-III synthase [Novosphingobium sp.]